MYQYGQVPFNMTLDLSKIPFLNNLIKKLIDFMCYMDLKVGWELLLIQIDNPYNQEESKAFYV